GIVFRQSGQLDNALEANDNAVRLAESTGDSGLIAPALAGLAEIHVAMEEFELAVHEATRAMEMAEQAGDPLVAAEANRILALALIPRRELHRALKAVTSARETAVTYQSRLLEGESTAALALVLRAMRREVESESWRDIAHRIFAELHADGFRDDFDRLWDGEHGPERKKRAWEG
ncbi:MAG TPA: tetratricopeptide repeat protein, partial [Gemmatimonadales bacterium]|nr:tetratricopeptide repeat protein [Gemmatimonadales bacterium]